MRDVFVVVFPFDRGEVAIYHIRHLLQLFSLGWSLLCPKSTSGFLVQMLIRTVYIEQFEADDNNKVGHLGIHYGTVLHTAQHRLWDSISPPETEVVLALTYWHQLLHSCFTIIGLFTIALWLSLLIMSDRKSVV